MYYYTDSKISILALGLFFVIVVGYAGFEARGIIAGPQVSISSQSAAVHEALVNVTGKAERISSLTLNGSAVSVTQDGRFDQEFLLSPGENTLTLEGRDAYGRIATKKVSYTYQPIAIVSTTTDSTHSTSSGQASSPQADSVMTTTTTSTTTTQQ